jgi:hypothetical protein
MSGEAKVASSRRGRRRLWTLLTVVILLVAALVLPPFISIAHYKGRITEVMARALGRAVHLSSVELVLLPRPGFELHDLVVEEDPAFGAEPVLHANTVEASIRLWSLWRGKLEISRISVDEASLNLVRTEQGRWNVDALFRSAANGVGVDTSAVAAGETYRQHQFPTLVATNSRINFKRGIEKLPYSLSNAELNLSTAGAGAWDITLRAQPVRTDLTLEPADTGEIRLNASLHNAAELRQMPLKLEMEWRKAQLGQLTRLLLGADAGWRGDLTGNLTLDGTAGDAVVKSRLRATNVHRVEFAPNSPLDFDANCSFAYHSHERTLEKLICDSPLGSGQLHLTGRVQGKTGDNVQVPAELGTALSFQLKNLPAGAGLDILRTLRASLLPGIEAKGVVNGQLSYIEPEVPLTADAPTQTVIKNKSEHKLAPLPSPLSGSFTIDGFELTGGALRQPLKIAKIELAPIAAVPGEAQALEATIPLMAGETAPLLVDVRLERKSYHVSAHGAASVARALEFSEALGFIDATKAPMLSGGSVIADLSAEGPWITGFSAAPDNMGGTATLHNTKLAVDALMNPVEITQGTLHFDASGMSWDAVNFNYGTLKGTASFLAKSCATPCTIQESAHFTVKLVALDASTIEAAMLGAHERGTMVSNLLARLKPEKKLAWSAIEGTVQAESITLGPITLTTPHMDLKLEGAKATITNLDAGVLGGTAHASGSFELADGKPNYALKISLTGAKAQEVGHIVGQNWSGTNFNADGDLKLVGFTGNDLASSASGTMHFDWSKGSLATTSPAILPTELEKSLARFDHWSGDATIGGGAIKLGLNQLTHAKENTSVDASVTLTEPAKMSFITTKPVKP